MDVPGADRAVRLIAVVSGSGDVTASRLLIEVGDFAIEATTSVYIQDLDLAPVEASDLFLQSVEVDRAIFRDCLELGDQPEACRLDSPRRPSAESTRSSRSPG